jgi:hypothetical protein
VALPIFKPIIEAIWAEHIAPKAPLAGPSREVQRQLIDVPIDYASGNPLNAPANNGSGLGGLFGAFAGNAQAAAPPAGGGGFIEHIRRDAEGKAEDTQYQIVSREDAYVRSEQGYDQNSYYGGQGSNYGGYGSDGRWTTGRTYYPNQGWGPAPQQPPQPLARGLFQPWGSQNSAPQPAPRREPDYFWGGRYN